MTVGLLDRLLGSKTETNPNTQPLPEAQVTPDQTRCMQCGVCNHHCPVGISVRDFARQGRRVDDERCVQCGVCVEVCPRGTLKWERPSSTFTAFEVGDYAALTALFFGDRAG